MENITKLREKISKLDLTNDFELDLYYDLKKKLETQINNSLDEIVSDCDDLDDIFLSDEGFSDFENDINYNPDLLFQSSKTSIQTPNLFISRLFGTEEKVKERRIVDLKIPLREDEYINYSGCSLNQDDLNFLLLIISRIYIVKESNQYSLLATAKLNDILNDWNEARGVSYNANSREFTELRERLHLFGDGVFTYYLNGKKSISDTRLIKSTTYHSDNQIDFEFDYTLFQIISEKTTYINKYAYTRLNTKLAKFLFMQACKHQVGRLQSIKLDTLTTMANISRTDVYIKNTIPKALQELLSFNVISSYYIDTKNKILHFIPTRNRITNNPSTEKIENNPNITLDAISSRHLNKKKNEIREKILEQQKAKKIEQKKNIKSKVSI